MRAFDFFSPQTLTEAKALLNQYGEVASILAGGMAQGQTKSFTPARGKSKGFWKLTTVINRQRPWFPTV